jgi:PPOX class probable F420-dependent enzyme
MLQRVERTPAGWHNSATLQPFTRTGTIVLTTYRRNGTPVTTPVSIAFDGDRAFFRTWDRSGKAKRLRRNPTVEIAPSNLAGKQMGEAIRARACLLTGSEATIARRALADRHPILQGMLVPLTHRLMRYRTLHFELIPEID